MITIIGYGFDAALHCPSCTRAALDDRVVTSTLQEPRDEHALPEAMKDSACNPVHPLFSCDEPSDGGEHCASCHEDLRA